MHRVSTIFNFYPMLPVGYVGSVRKRLVQITAVALMAWGQHSIVFLVFIKQSIQFQFVAIFVSMLIQKEVRNNWICV